MKPTRLPTTDFDGPPVLNSQLRALVDMARAQPLPRIEVDAEAIHRGFKQRRAKQRRWAGLAAAAAIVVGLSATMVPGLGDRGPGETGASDRVAVSQPGSDRDSLPTSGQPQPARAETPEDEGLPTLPTDPRALEPTSTPPALASGVRIRLQSAAEPAASPEAPEQPTHHDDVEHDAESGSIPSQGFFVTGTWEVSVAAGRYEIEVPADAAEPLAVTVLDRKVLEVQPGSVVRLDTLEAEPEVEVVEGRAGWKGEDGEIIASNRSAKRTKRHRRRALEPAPTVPTTKKPEATPEEPSLPRSMSAAELARKAEMLMATGNRKEAIDTYEQLVRKYPTSSATRAGLLDLAKLLERDGRRSRARCAYQLYLDRWPGASTRKDIQRALDELGGSRRCRGLDPR